MAVFLPGHATAEKKASSMAMTMVSHSHKNLLLQLAEKYADPIQLNKRLDELLIAEAAIVSELPIRLALH